MSLCCCEEWVDIFHIYSSEETNLSQLSKVLGRLKSTLYSYPRWICRYLGSMVLGPWLVHSSGSYVYHIITTGHHDYLISGGSSSHFLWFIACTTQFQMVHLQGCWTVGWTLPILTRRWTWQRRPRSLWTALRAWQLITWDMGHSHSSLASIFTIHRYLRWTHFEGGRLFGYSTGIRFVLLLLYSDGEVYRANQLDISTLTSVIGFEAGVLLSVRRMQCASIEDSKPSIKLEWSPRLWSTDLKVTELDLGTEDEESPRSSTQLWQAKWLYCVIYVEGFSESREELWKA